MRTTAALLVVFAVSGGALAAQEKPVPKDSMRDADTKTSARFTSSRSARRDAGSTTPTMSRSGSDILRMVWLGA